MCLTQLAFLLLLTPQESIAPAPAAPPAPAAREAQTPEPWGFEKSDIPVDPRIQFATLPNGMRLAWADNKEPKERVYLRLHVNAGSLAEQESERGMAHFLEHMAFNGSENFGAGTLIEWFQNHGMSFGADTNAHTAFSETVYKLDLPNNTEATIKEGLTVMRDFASRLDLSEEEVQAEKGVIDGEERERDSAGYRAFVKLMENQMAGTRVPDRLPIGTKEIRDTFNAKNVRAFYERWYRPENMTLVIVGDLGELDVAALMTEAFGDFAGPGTPVEPEPALGKPSMKSVNFTVPEPEIPIAQLMVANLKPYQHRQDSAAERQRQMTLNVAQQMLSLRFQEALKDPETHFLRANVGENGDMKVFEGGELTVVTNPDDWQQGLKEAAVTLRSALEFGFQEAELDEVRAGILRSLDEAVERESTADSTVLLDAILDAAEEHNVPTNAAVDKRLFGAILRAMTVEDCHKALQASWSEGTLSLIAIGSVPFENAAEAMNSAWKHAWELELKAPEKLESAEFAYASAAIEQAPITSLSRVKDLDFSQIVMSNGVRVNLKQTDFKERQILVRVRLGNGMCGMSPAEGAVAQVASDAFIGGGLEAHDADALRRLLAGKQARVGFAVKDDHIEFESSTTQEDLVLALEMICAYLQHPGYRPDALVQVRAQLPIAFQKMDRSPEGPLTAEYLPAFIKGNPRIEWLGWSPRPELASLMTVSMDEIRSLLTPRFAHDPIELTIVGDLDLPAALLAVGRTFGSLPERSTKIDPEEGRGGVEMVSGIDMRREIETKDEKATLILTYPTADGSDDTRRRLIYFLGQVVDDRLRLEVRERLGAAYSPFAAAQASRVFHGLGGLMIQAAGNPAEVDTLIAACRGVCATLAKDGVTQEEVNRLAEPIQNRLRDMLRTNRYWVDSLSESQKSPSTLDGLRTLVSFYDNIDAKALSRLAAAFLTEDKASQLVVMPKRSAEKGAPIEAGENK
ncbi:MAG: insulinase family protein [Planctomycetota bacterium]